MNIPAFALQETIWLGGPETADADGWFESDPLATWTETGVLDPPLVIGDSTRVSQKVISSFVWYDLSGGIGVDEQNESSDVSRTWFGAWDTSRPGQNTLPPEVLAAKPSGASGTCWPLGRVGETLYALFGTSIKGWNEGAGAFYAAAATGISGTPASKPVSFKGSLFVPYGSAGYLVLAESGTPGTLNAPTSVTGGIGVPGTFTAGSPVTTSPLPVAFTVWDQKLWALSTSGAVCWSKTGADNTWTWLHNDAYNEYVALESGQTPKRLFTYRNAAGQDSLYATTATGLFILDDIALVFRTTPLKDAPSVSGFGDSVATWRYGEDAWVSMGLDVYHWSPEGAVVPFTGPSRDHGLPQKYAGRVTDLCAEFSALYMLVQGGVAVSTAASVDTEDRGAGFDDAGYVPATSSAPCLLRWTGIGYICDWEGVDSDGTPTWAVVGDVASAGGTAVDGYRLWWGSTDGNLRNIKLFPGMLNPKERWRSGRGRYAQSSSLISCRTDCGMAGFLKVAGSASIRCDAADLTYPVTLAYQTGDMEASNPDWFIDLGTASQIGRSYFGFKWSDADPYFSGVGFDSIRLKWSGLRPAGSPALTPVWADTTLDFVKVPKTTTAPNVSLKLPNDKDRWGRSAQDVVNRVVARIGPETFSVLVIGDQVYRGWITGASRRSSTGKPGGGALDLTFLQVKTGVAGAVGE